jgi:glycosyltransferase involved in cell wall biosynthesis
MTKNLICAIYNHPEAYPPTLNALRELSKIYEKIYVIYRPNLSDQWHYPGNVILIRSGKEISTHDQAALGATKKILLFFSFTYIFLKSFYKYKPQTILLYDSIALFSYDIIKYVLRGKFIVWYHNHDVTEIEKARRCSLVWWSAKAEKRAFSYLNIFSLPSNERMKYFNLKAFKGKYFYLPNFPAISFYSRFRKSKRPESTIKLIFQGSISSGHGIEEVIHFIKESKKDIQLILIGNIEGSYRNYLNSLIESLHVEKSVEIVSAVNYEELPMVTTSAHIGLAMSKPENIVYETGGTASNKIYEYAACGLPVLYYDNVHYKEYLGKYKWAFANDLSNEILDEQIEYIVTNYENLSGEAICDFESDLNFEKAFNPLLLILREMQNKS